MAKTIRHYERTGLIPQVARTVAGYRLYSDADLHRLRFIKRARALGFSMKQIEVLLELWSDRSRASAQVKKLAQQHADELGVRIGGMQAMQRRCRNWRINATATTDRTARSSMISQASTARSRVGKRVIDAC